MKYIWQHKNFPTFKFISDALTDLIQAFALQSGEVNGMLQGLTKKEKDEFLVHIMLSEALKTSEIEGEYYSRLDVMSSIRNQLGLHNSLPKTKDKKALTIAQLMWEVRKDYNQELTIEMIQRWHNILMASEVRINAGQWRAGIEPMQIVSGSYGSIQVHYEAPPAADVEKMMLEFVKWYHSFSFQSLGKVGEAMLKSSLTHLYFETIHPFEDGNGRIGRALAEKALAEHLDMPLYISLSKKIEDNKKKYYDSLKIAQQNIEVTDWLDYFFNLIVESEIDVKTAAIFTIEKTVFFDRFKEKLNPRQLKAIQKMLEHGKDGFEGGMTAKKYISINSTSKATATRDLQEFVDIEAFISQGSGRSAGYMLNL